MKLAVFSSKIIQYKSPLYKYLAAQPGLDLTVYYYTPDGSPYGANGGDPLPESWDTSLLDGYRYEFLENRIDPIGWKWNAVGPFFNPELLQRLRTQHFDAAIIHSYQYPSDWLVLAASKVFKTRVLFYGEMQPVPLPDQRRRIARGLIHRAMIRGCDACLAVSSSARRVFEEEFSLPARRVFDAPYSVDNDFFIQQVDQWRSRKAEIKQRLGIQGDLPVVLYVSRMVEGKGHSDLIQAFQTLQSHARLVLVGYGSLEDDIRRLCRETAPETIVTGFINQSELPRYYAAADLFVHPSHQESFGVVINEAMCAGLAILASSGVAAARDLVIEGANGELFPAGDMPGLADRMADLLADREKLRCYGDCSRQTITSWGIDRTAAGILNALNEIVR